MFSTRYARFLKKDLRTLYLVRYSEGMENLGFMILRISILAVFIVLGSLLYEWVKAEMQKREITFKQAVLDSLYGVWLVIAFIVGFPFMLFILYAIFISPIIAMFGMM